MSFPKHTSSTTWFSTQLLQWYRIHGRHDLPWKGKDFYTVWLSEIMLQQTQVKTVLPYYQRFLKHFPTLNALATASEDDVLTQWSGLGYYARARNLHRTAQILNQQKTLPQNPEAIQKLPGIGKSTANAIASFVYQYPAAILDGNVRRSLSRVFGIYGNLHQPTQKTTLWKLAEQLLPADEQVSDYNQAIMDLGALICTRAAPHCTQCPLQNKCFAYQNNQVDQLPEPIRRAPKKLRTLHLAVLINQHQQSLLHKQSTSGIWKGLWSFPELPLTETPLQALHSFAAQHHCTILNTEQPPPIKHLLTHIQMLIYPIIGHCMCKDSLPDSTRWQWLLPAESAHTALPTPIKKLLSHL